MRRPHLSLEQYREIDLFFLAVIAFLAELVITLASARWFPDQLYTVSVTAAITAIVAVRWKGYAVIQSFLGGAALCIGLGANPKQWLIYCIGNLAFLVMIPFLKLVGEKKIRGNAVWTILYGALTLFAMQTGRAVLALALGGTIRDAAAFYATDSLSYVFTVVILWIAGRQDGILEDQKEYLARLHAQMEAEKEEFQ
ncbi:MAG: hypothetical protein J6Z33_10340 [Lachnospiraceae bacterium]|nr:hypothetical protein [Lachnospiraceae bacterium]MBO7338674.1 hypothetical protein [Lachnospiraceae bacterium]MBP5264753.1 hypothetical protein [Lachnospiraceae bacterium]